MNQKNPKGGQYTPPSDFYHFINNCIHRYKLKLTHINHDIVWFGTGSPLYPINKKETIHLLLLQANSNKFNGFTYDCGHWTTNCRVSLEHPVDEIMNEIEKDIPHITQIGFKK